LVADAFLWYGRRYGVQAAIVNAGGIREGMTAPEVNLKKVYSVLPFDNTLDVVTLTGEQLTKMIEAALLRAEQVSSGCFPQVSGMRIVYDSKHDCLKSLKIQSGHKFKNVKKRSEYKIAINSFIANGGDGYKILADADASMKMSGLAPQQEVLAGYLQTHSSNDKQLDVTKLVDGRIVVRK